MKSKVVEVTLEENVVENVSQGASLAKENVVKDESNDKKESSDKIVSEVKIENAESTVKIESAMSDDNDVKPEDVPLPSESDSSQSSQDESMMK